MWEFIVVENRLMMKMLMERLTAMLTDELSEFKTKSHVEMFLSMGYAPTSGCPLYRLTGIIF
jgi:hypothetical protein